MTTQAWSFPIDHQNDAGFRAWGADFAAKLLAVGLVNTSDTGQINWATVARPGINTDGGYEVWRLNDSMQATAPIFLKFYYGTAAAALRPRIRMEMGTGSNGSGTLTGLGSGTVLIVMPAGSVGDATGTARNSHMVAVDGFFGFIWNEGGADAGATQIADAQFYVARTVDSAGAASAVGAQIVYPDSGSTVGAQNFVRSFRYASTAAAYTASNSGRWLVNPGFESGSLVGADTQIFVGWLWTPRVLPNMFLCGCIAAEHAGLATFTATLVGASSRTYLSLAGRATIGLGLVPAMLWE